MTTKTEEGQPPEEVRDPEAKARSEEAARYRTQLRAAEAERDRLAARIKELEAADPPESLEQQAERATEAEQLRVELAAWKLNATRDDPFTDLDVALRQVDLGAVTFHEDGSPQGLAEALDHVARRYPYLLRSAQATPVAPTTPPVQASGAPVGSQRQQKGGLDRAKLRSKYPALRRDGSRGLNIQRRA